MNRTDKEGKQMLLTIYEVYNNPDNGFATKRPGLVAPMGLVQTQINKIIGAQTAAGMPIHGNTVDKENKFDLLAHALFHIASAGSGYYSAPATADAEKKATVNYTLSQVLHVSYNEMEAFSLGIINVITPIIGELADFGAVPDDLTDASTKRTKFIAAQTAPQEAKDERQVQNANIHPYIVEAKKILDEQCDSIIGTMFGPYYDLYELWHTGRKIVHLPHGTTVVEGFVYLADGITPVYHADINFADQGLSTQSFIDGSYRVVKFPHGVTTATARLDALSQTLPPVEVKLGHTVKLNFKL